MVMKHFKSICPEFFIESIYNLFNFVLFINFFWLNGSLFSNGSLPTQGAPVNSEVGRYSLLKDSISVIAPASTQDNFLKELVTTDVANTSEAHSEGLLWPDSPSLLFHFFLKQYPWPVIYLLIFHIWRRCRLTCISASHI